MEFIVNEKPEPCWALEEVYKREGIAIATQEVPICQHQPVPRYFQLSELWTCGEISYDYTDMKSAQK
jgi:hypothetical protein